MDRREPRYRGGPPGKHGDGTNRLSDAEDSVIERKKSLNRQRWGKMARLDRDSNDEDNVRGLWEEYPTRESDDEGMNSGRRSTRGGPGGRRGVGSHDMDDLMEDMDLNQRGESYDDSDLIISDLPILRERRAYIMETLKHAENAVQRRNLKDNLEMIKEDIARLEYGQRGSGKMPRGMGAPSGSMDSNSRQSRAGGRGPRETRGDFHDDSRMPFDISELSQLKKDHDSEMKKMKRFADSGDVHSLRMAEANLDRMSENIDYLQRQSAKLSRGIGAPTRRQDREDYSDYKSEYQPRGSRRGHQGSATGRGGNYGR
ncbi:MAG: hypothetical protein Q9175_003821 [Cornicularia normoerica]